MKWNLSNKVMHLSSEDIIIGLNYAQEGIRQSIRYMPLVVEVSFFYAHISDDPPLISSLHTLVGVEYVATLGDFENAYRRLNEIFDEDPKFKAFLKGRLLDNPYTALCLEKTATLEDIKHAYREIALECHPDKNPNITTK